METGITITCVDCDNTFDNISEYNAHSDSCTPLINIPEYPETFMITEPPPNSNVNARHFQKAKPSTSVRKSEYVIPANQDYARANQRIISKKQPFNIKTKQDLLIRKLLRTDDTFPSSEVVTEVSDFPEIPLLRRNPDKSLRTTRKSVHVCREELEEEYEIVVNDKCADSPIIAVATNSRPKKAKIDDEIHFCEQCFQTFCTVEQLEVTY